MQKKIRHCFWVLLLLALAACGGGSGGVGPGSVGNGGAGSTSASELANDAADIPARYISNQDASPTWAAVAAGLNPRYDIISDNFECHDLDDIDYSAPDLVFTVSGSSYASAQGSGQLSRPDDEEPPTNEYILDGGPFSTETFYLRFDDFGQWFEADTRSGEVRCFQAGARAEQALTQFRLNTPAAANYNCRDVDSGQIQVLSIDPSGQYLIGGLGGTYSVSDLIEGTRSRLEFVGGPFDGERAFYSAEADSGYQSFQVTTSTTYGIYPVGASSELAVLCERIGEPEYFAEYGNAFYEALPQAAIPLSGLYFELQQTSSVDLSSSEAQYYRFDTDGRVFIGVPHPAGIDCRRTRPNGLPYCDSYTVEGNTLTLIRATREPDTRTIEYAGTTIARLGDEPLVPVQSVQAASLVGNWENLYFSQSGICGPYSACSSFFAERDLRFAADGRFLRVSSTQSTSSFDTGLGSTYAFGSSNSNLVGTYEVAGNFLTLRYDNGRVVQEFVNLTSNPVLGVGDLAYFIDSGDE